jgi:hypothetical protein
MKACIVHGFITYHNLNGGHKFLLNSDEKFSIMQSTFGIKFVIIHSFISFQHRFALGSDDERMSDGASRYYNVLPAMKMTICLRWKRLSNFLHSPARATLIDVLMYNNNV